MAKDTCIKVPPVMSGFLRVFAKRPELKSEKYCSDSEDTCIMASGNDGHSGLWVGKDICEIRGPGDSVSASVANEGASRLSTPTTSGDIPCRVIRV